ncbi:MAG TPA: hypothetical protein VJ911_09255, partial [Cryomorphaceae bacterium]|nr:hypothetical protein [Cryomorphaceae bacterium]
MFPRVPFKSTKAYERLEKQAARFGEIHIRDLFHQDAERFKKYTKCFENILLDYSKNRIDDYVMEELKNLAEECKLSEAIDAMFSGERINEMENRAVLHTALRYRGVGEIKVDGKDVMPDVKSVLEQMERFANRVIGGDWKGHNGKPIQAVVNIGIGGSDLGPVMVTEALKPYCNHLDVHFVSNIDGTHISEVLKRVNPDTTLFIIASKTFTTQETMTNAHTAREWFLDKTGADELDVKKHFVALSINTEGVKDFGIHPDNMFAFWDWVGGRYSLWSAIGLSIALAVGFENFRKLLEGAYAMDEHFKSQKAESMPGILALLGIWYNNFLGAE